MDYFLTKKRFEEFSSELEDLKTNKRLEVAEKLRNAKALGDLSENSEYLEARDGQERVERRISDLEEILKHAKIIKKGGSKKSVCDVGSKVEVSRNNKPLTFVIVGTSEAKPEEGYISNQSPLGRELIGKKVGDKVVVDAPSGKVEYKIKRIM